MPLVTTKQMLERAMQEGYGVGAFNINCLDMAWPLIEAAEIENAPLILQIGQCFLDFMQPEIFMPYIKSLVERADVPIAIHLDHSHSLEQNIRCLRAGFTSLMYDGSALPLDENIARTREVVGIAHACDIPVEGEVGIVKIYDGNQDSMALSDPDEVQQFVEDSGVDSVAVSVGNIHKMPQKTARIDFDRIIAIRRRINIPMVLHGSTGISNDDVIIAVKSGVTKVNIATEFNRVFCKQVKYVMENNFDRDFPMEVLMPAIKAIKELARKKFKLLGCSGKGGDFYRSQWK